MKLLETPLLFITWYRVEIVKDTISIVSPTFVTQTPI